MFLDILKGRLEKAATVMEDRVKALIKSPGQDGILIVIYFDEVQELRDKESEDGSESTRFSSLCWALDLLKKYDIFALFMSTNSDLRKIEPPQRIYSSARKTEITTLQPPLTELPFDLPGFRLDWDTLTLDKIKEPGFMCQFGRLL